MPRTKAFELEDALPHLPNALPLSDAPKEVDLYLCALGFEPRCLSIPQQMAAASRRISACRYIELNTNIHDNRNNLIHLQQSLAELSNDVSGLNADSTDFERQLHGILSATEGVLARPPRVVFDISVAANRLLLRTFRVLLDATVDLRIVYTEAAIYHPTEDEFRKNPDNWTGEEQLGTELGVGAIVPSAAYAGQHLDPLPNCVVLFPTFRKERSLAVICHVDETLVTNPRDNVVWILGVPPAESNRWRTPAMKVINQVDDNSPQFEVTTFDYRETLSLLERIYRERWTRFNITISPLGSKLQAIGTAMFMKLHPDVKLLFAAPRQYNATEWSDGVGQKWEITFGFTTELRKMLRRIGSLEVTG